MRKLLILSCLLLAGQVFGQSITFTADIVQADGSATPTLTWDTEPLASDCVASGDWSGNKGAAGNETLQPITSSATYNLSCSWSADSATLSWTAPTQNTDGTALTDLAGYRLYSGTVQGGPYELAGDVDNPSVTSFIVQPLSTGTWYFAATSYNAIGVESAFSNEAMKVLADEVAQESVGIVINPVPMEPGNLIAQ